MHTEAHACKKDNIRFLIKKCCNISFVDKNMDWIQNIQLKVYLPSCDDDGAAEGGW